MDLIQKSKIFNSDIKEHPSCRNDYEYAAGYFTDVVKITDNQEFLEVYRHVQHFGFPITIEMEKYASIPNYAPESLIAQMAITGEDDYFTKMKALIENPDNVYMASQFFDLSEREKIFTHIVENDRADLTSKYYEDGYPPEDIYCHVANGNACLEVVTFLMEHDYIPSDEIITWYLMKGMGGIAKKSITEYTDIPFVMDCKPCDIQAFRLIEEKRGYPFDSSECQKILFMIVSDHVATDVALLIELFNKIKNELTSTEKFDLLKRLLTKNEKFAIYIFMKLLKEDGFSNNQIENQTFFINKSIPGYIILKLQIEECTDLDVIADMAFELTTDKNITYYSEDQNGFISAQNEKYCNSSDDDDSYYESSNDGEHEDGEAEEYEDTTMGNGWW